MAPPDPPAKRSRRTPASAADDRVKQLAGPLRQVLRRLPEIERRVVELRMGLVDGHPADVADTARALGLTLQETRDVEQRAFDRIREVVPLDRLEKLLDT